MPRCALLWQLPARISPLLTHVLPAKIYQHRFAEATHWGRIFLEVTFTLLSVCDLWFFKKNFKVLLGLRKWQNNFAVHDITIISYMYMHKAPTIMFKDGFGSGVGVQVQTIAYTFQHGNISSISSISRYKLNKLIWFKCGIARRKPHYTIYILFDGF